MDWDLFYLSDSRIYGGYSTGWDIVPVVTGVILDVVFTDKDGVVPIYRGLFWRYLYNLILAKLFPCIRGLFIGIMLTRCKIPFLFLYFRGYSRGVVGLLANLYSHVNGGCSSTFCRVYAERHIPVYRGLFYGQTAINC